MALVACPDCGKEVSDAAPTCPGCGRPTASTPRFWRRPIGTGGRLVLWTVILVGAFAIYVVASHLEPLQAVCTMNGLGSGQCTFTNMGFVPTRLCGRVGLRREQGGDEQPARVSSEPFCSGLVWPKSSVQLPFVLPETRTMCEVSGGLSWTDVCSFKFLPD